MKAIRFEGTELCVKDVPTPVPGLEEVLVRITTSGVCHSDLHLARGHWQGMQPPMIGHEAIGVVEALGPGAERFSSVGDRVILGLGGMLGYWCGACHYCLGGEPRLCKQAKGILGTFAEEICVWAGSLVPLPDDVDDLEAPLACGGLTAYGAVKKLLAHDVLPGRPIGIVGAAGGLGHYAVQIASSFGYRVVGVDIGTERLEFVRGLGALHAVEPGDAVQLVRSEFDGVDGVLVFTAALAGFDLGLKMLRRGGLFVAVGIPPTSEGDIRLNPMEFFHRSPTLMYSAGGTVQDMRELVDLASRGKVKSHVSRTGALSEVPAIFDELEAGKYLGRAVITDMAG